MQKTPKKVLSFILAVVILFSSFGAGLSALAVANTDDLKYNYMDWSVLTYEQQMDLIFDYLDQLLAQMNFTMDLSVLGKLDARSVNALVGSVKSLGSKAQNNSGLLGDLKGITFAAFDGLSATQARQDQGEHAIVKAIFNFIGNKDNGKIVNTLLWDPANFSLGLVGNFVTLDIGGMLGIKKGQSLHEALAKILVQAIYRESEMINAVTKTLKSDEYRPITDVYYQLTGKNWSDSIMNTGVAELFKDQKTHAKYEYLYWWAVNAQKYVADYNAKIEKEIDEDNLTYPNSQEKELAKQKLRATYTPGENGTVSAAEKNLASDNLVIKAMDDTITLKEKTYKVFDVYTFTVYRYYSSNVAAKQTPATLMHTWEANYINGKNSQHGSGEEWDTYWNYWNKKAEDYKKELDKGDPKGKVIDLTDATALNKEQPLSGVNPNYFNRFNLDDYVWDVLVGPENPKNDQAKGFLERLINTIKDPTGEITFPPLNDGAVRRILAKQNADKSYSRQFNTIADIIYNTIKEIWNPYIVPMLNTIDIDTSGFDQILKVSPAVYKMVNIFNLDWHTDPANKIARYTFTNDGLSKEYNNIAGYIVKNFISSDIRGELNWENNTKDHTDAQILDIFVNNFKKLVVFFITKTDASMLPEAMKGKTLAQIYAAWNTYKSMKVSEIMFEAEKVVVSDFFTMIHKDELAKANNNMKLVYIGFKELAAQYIPDHTYDELPAVNEGNYATWPLDSSGKKVNDDAFDIASDIITYFLEGNVPLYTDISTRGSASEKYYKLSDSKNDANRKSLFDVVNYAASWYLYGDMQGVRLAGFDSIFKTIFKVPKEQTGSMTPLTEKSTLFEKLDYVIKYLFDFTVTDKTTFFKSEDWLGTTYVNGQIKGKIWQYIFNMDFENVTKTFDWLYKTKAIQEYSLLQTAYALLYNISCNFISRTSQSTKYTVEGQGGNWWKNDNAYFLPNTWDEMNLKTAHDGVVTKGVYENKPLNALTCNGSLIQMVTALRKFLEFRVDDFMPVVASLAGSLSGITAEQSVKAASATVSSNYNNSFNTGSIDYTFYNNCMGIKRAYKDASGVQQKDTALYQAVITDVKITATNTAGTEVSHTIAVANLAKDKIVASAGYIKGAVSGTINGDESIGSDAIVTISVKYNIIDETGINSRDHYIFKTDQTVERKIYYIWDYQTYYDRVYTVLGKDTDAGDKDSNFVMNTSGSNESSKYKVITQKTRTAKTYLNPEVDTGKMKFNMPAAIVTDTEGTNLDRYLWYVYNTSIGSSNAQAYDGLYALEGGKAVGEKWTHLYLYNSETKGLIPNWGDKQDWTYYLYYDFSWLALGERKAQSSTVALNNKNGYYEAKETDNKGNPKTPYPDYHLPMAGAYYEAHDKYGFIPKQDSEDLDDSLKTGWYSIPPETYTLEQRDLNFDGTIDKNDFVYHNVEESGIAVVDRYSGIDIATMRPGKGINGNRICWMRLFDTKKNLSTQLRNNRIGWNNTYRAEIDTILWTNNQGNNLTNIEAASKVSPIYDEPIQAGHHDITLNFWRGDNYQFPVRVYVQDTAARANLETVYNEAIRLGYTKDDFDIDNDPKAAKAWENFQKTIADSISAISSPVTLKYNSDGTVKKEGTFVLTNCDELNYRYYADTVKLRNIMEIIKPYVKKANADDFKKELENLQKTIGDRLNYEYYTYQRYESAKNNAWSILENGNSTLTDMESALTVVKAQASHLIKRIPNNTVKTEMISKLNTELARKSIYVNDKGKDAWTTRSWDKYQNAIARAQAALAGENYTDKIEKELDADNNPQFIVWNYGTEVSMIDIKMAREYLMMAENGLTGKNEVTYNVIFRTHADPSVYSASAVKKDTTINDLVKPVSTRVKTGHTFVGWNLIKADEKGVPIRDTDGNIQVLTKVIAYDGKVYVAATGTNKNGAPVEIPLTTTLESLAQTYYGDKEYPMLVFESACEMTVYTITYNMNNDDATNPGAFQTTDGTAEKKTYTMLDEVTLETPVRKGFEFLGWFSASSPSGSQVAITKIPVGSTGDRTYYAQWRGRDLGSDSRYDFVVDYNGTEWKSTTPFPTDITLTLANPKETLPSGISFNADNNGLVIDAGGVKAEGKQHTIQLRMLDTLTKNDYIVTAFIYVNKINRTGVDWTVKSKEYDGTELAMTNFAAAKAGEDALPTDTTFTVTDASNNPVTNVVNAGTYKFTVTVPATAHYLGATYEQTVVISKKTFAAKDFETQPTTTKEYDNTATAAATLAENIVPTNIKAITGYSVKLKSTAAGATELYDTVTNVGSYVLVVTIPNSTNYNGTNFVITAENGAPVLTITAKVLNISTHDVVRWAKGSLKATAVYDGTAKKITSITSQEPTIYDVTFAYPESVNYINVGEKAVTATVTCKNTNYVLTDGTNSTTAENKTLTFDGKLEITQATLVLSADVETDSTKGAYITVTADKPADGANPAGKIKVTVTKTDDNTNTPPIVPPIEISLTTTDGVTKTEKTQVLTDSQVQEQAANNANLTFTYEYVEAANDNYTAQDGFVTAGATLEQLAGTVSVTADRESFIYGEDATFTVSYTGGETVTYGINLNSTYFSLAESTETPGVFKAKVIAASPTDASVSNLYSASVSKSGYATKRTAPVSAVVARKAITVDIASDGKVYDGNTSGTIKSFTAVGAPGDKPVTITSSNMSATYDSKAAGNNRTLTASVAPADLVLSDTNYKVTAINTATVTITQKPLTFTFDITSKVYNGKVNDFTVSNQQIIGLVAGDDVAMNITAAKGSTEDGAGVGVKTVTVSGYTLSGADLANYSYSADETTGPYTTGMTGTITQATYKIVIKDTNEADKVIDQNITYNPANTLSALVGKLTVERDTVLFTDKIPYTVKVSKPEKAVEDPTTISAADFKTIDNFTTLDEGVYYVKVEAANSLNVAYTSSIVKFTVVPDKTPHIEINYTNTASKTVTISIAAWAGISGRETFKPTVEVQKNGETAWTAITLPDSANNANGKYTVDYQVDHDGEYTFKATYDGVSETKTATITKVDSTYITAQNATATINGTQTAYTPGKWARNVTFKLTVDDSYGTNAAKNKKFEYTIDGGVEWKQIGNVTTSNTATLSVSDNTINKTYKFQVTITNKDGSTRIIPISPEWQSVNIDSQKPTPSTDCIVVPAESQNTASVSISPKSANIGPSGIAKVEIAQTTKSTQAPTDASAWTALNTSPYNFTAEHKDNQGNDYTIWVKITDGAGNVSDPISKDIQITRAYTIVFKDVNDNTIPDASGLFNKGTTVNFPTALQAGVNPESHNCVWKNGETVLTGNTVTVTDNMEITAEAVIKTFTVKFYEATEGEATLSTQTINWGTAATEPTAKPVAPEGMTFAYWDADFTNVRSDLEIRPVFTNKTTFTVTFMDKDGKALTTTATVVDDGTLNANQIPASIKASYQTTESDWTYAGLETRTEGQAMGEGTAFVPGTTVVKGNVTVYPVYTATKRVYTVTFKQANNTANAKPPVSVNYNNPVGEAAAPKVTKESDNTYSYTFKHWSLTENGTKYDLATTPVTGNVVLYPVFDQENIKYTVTFLHDDGTTTLAVKKYNYNELLAEATQTGYEDLVKAYNAAGPDKTIVATATNAQYTCQWVGWAKQNDSTTLVNQNTRVTSDFTVQAKFNKEINKYTVTLYDADGSKFSTTLDEQNYGTNLIKLTENLKTPDKPGDDQYVSYSFLGWTLTKGSNDVITDKDIVTGKTNLYPVYENGNLKEYTVEIRSAGVELLTKKYTYGAAFDADAKAAIKAEINAKLKAGDYASDGFGTDYYFSGWNNESNLPATIKQNHTNAGKNAFTVTLSNDTGFKLKIRLVYWLGGDTTNNSSYTDFNDKYTESTVYASGTTPVLPSVRTISGYAVDRMISKTGYFTAKSNNAALENLTLPAVSEANYKNTALDDGSGTNTYIATYYLRYVPNAVWVQFYNAQGERIDPEQFQELKLVSTKPVIKENDLPGDEYKGMIQAWETEIGWRLGATKKEAVAPSYPIDLESRAGDTLKFWYIVEDYSIEIRWHNGDDVKSQRAKPESEIEVTTVSVAKMVTKWTTKEADNKYVPIVTQTAEDGRKFYTLPDTLTKATGLDLYLYLTPNAVTVNFYNTDGRTLLGTKDVNLSADIMKVGEQFKSKVSIDAKAGNYFRGWIFKDANVSETDQLFLASLNQLDSWVVDYATCGTSGLNYPTTAQGGPSLNTIELKGYTGKPMTVFLNVIGFEGTYIRSIHDVQMLDALVLFKAVTGNAKTDNDDTKNTTTIDDKYVVSSANVNLVSVLKVFVDLKKMNGG